MAMKRTDIYITQMQWTSLKKLAKRDGRRVSEHVRIAVDRYLEEELNEGAPSRGKGRK